MCQEGKHNLRKTTPRSVLHTEDLVTHVGDVVKHCLVLHHEVLLKYLVKLH
jgi:hypothetical protein